MNELQALRLQEKIASDMLKEATNQEAKEFFENELIAIRKDINKINLSEDSTTYSSK